MKRFSFPNLLIFALAGTIALTGCKHPAQPVTPIPNMEPPVVTQPSVDQHPIRTRPTTPTPPPTQPIIDQNNTPDTNVIPGKGLTGDNTPANPIPANFGQDWPTDVKQFEADTVYFDFDRAVVKDSEKSKIQAVADYFKDPKNSANHLVIEGHCDERGTEGYNLALGDRRALAVRDQLIQLGVGADKIHTVSYGLSRPAVLGHNEAAWSKNRRGVFVLATPPGGQPAAGQ
jgi:peptidoglycan-associated lipoprotein